MSSVLDGIVADKRSHVAKRKAAKPHSTLEDEARAANAPREFAASLTRAVSATGTGLIAEIKKASPSNGLIRKDFNPRTLAQAYAAGGAACLSVLTDTKYFQGADEFLTEVRTVVDLPLLRKDFLLDPYQVTESRAIGADCVLVILAAVDDVVAAELIDAAHHWHMDALLEVHDDVELDRAEKLSAKLFGINNRNLKTLDVNLSTTARLAARAPAEAQVISESGLNTPADLERMHHIGVHRFLVGTSLMKSADVTAATAALLAPASLQAVGG